jgi:hypothetical protein
LSHGLFGLLRLRLCGLTRGFRCRPVASRLFGKGLRLLRLILRRQTRGLGERSIAFRGDSCSLRLQPLELCKLACGFLGARSIECRSLALLRTLSLFGLERFFLLLE